MTQLLETYFIPGELGMAKQKQWYNNTTNIVVMFECI